MKHTSAFKNTTRSILIASVMFGVTGMVYAQSSNRQKTGQFHFKSRYAYLR